MVVVEVPVPVAVEAAAAAVTAAAPPLPAIICLLRVKRGQRSSGQPGHHGVRCRQDDHAQGQAEEGLRRPPNSHERGKTITFACRMRHRYRPCYFMCVLFWVFVRWFFF